MRRRKKVTAEYKLRGFTDGLEGVEISLVPEITVENNMLAYVFADMPYAATWYQMVVADPGVSEWTYDFPENAMAFVDAGATLTLYQSIEP